MNISKLQNNINIKLLHVFLRRIKKKLQNKHLNYYISLFKLSLCYELPVYLSKNLLITPFLITLAIYFPSHKLLCRPRSIFQFFFPFLLLSKIYKF